MNRVEKFQEIVKDFALKPYIQGEHYDTLVTWWMKHNQSILSKELLPDTGIVVMEGETPLAMTFIYFSNSKMAQIGWTVSNPDLGPKKKVLAVMMALEEAEQSCRDNGIVCAETFSSEPGLTKLFEAQGFSVARTHSLLFKNLKNSEEVIQ